VDPKIQVTIKELTDIKFGFRTGIKSSTEDMKGVPFEYIGETPEI
jgi:hypothetical protein